MKKQIFFLAVAAIAMASCSQDETIDINEGKGIGFRTSADKITRGTETNNSNITQFYVTAFDTEGDKYFADQPFTGTQNTMFTSDPLYYWPGDNSLLTFRAYAPDAKTIGGTMSLNLANGNNTLSGFSPATVIANQVDLIYATATGNKENNETTGVQLNFSHMLSQVSIKAINNNKGYKYNVKGVKIANVKKQGDLSFDKAVSENDKASAWSNFSTEKTSYTVTYNTAISLGETAKSIMTKDGDNAMLIPQQLTAWDGTNGDTGTYLAVLVNIETKSGAQVYPKYDETTAVDTEKYAWVAVGIDTKWEMGNHYIYTLDFSEGAGKPEPDPEKPDPDEPVDPVLGGPIKFKVNVTGG
ncbi:fimbrillin family protein [Bacteroides gallinarum]|uniref:fimbrillin family protein n=1 Tax=Bacteroides gallinarum TaxID=376806 RepID=UPI000555C8DD|nr:fimbrillin family protein [Bacteroides gallinarum]